MAFPSGYVLHNGFWYLLADGSGPYYINIDGEAIPIDGSGGSEVEDILDANLPAPSSENLNLEYQVTDVRGGVRVKSDGLNWIEQAPAINDVNGIPANAWVNRGSGSAVRDLQFITDLGNNPLVLAIWDGTRWQPFGGEQTIYVLRAEIVGDTGATSTATLPSITIPGGLMGVNGGLDIEVSTSTDVTPVTNTPSITFDGYDLAGGSAGTNRRLWLGRRVRNRNSAAAQIVMAAAGSNGAFQFLDNDHRSNTKNTANDLTLAGSIVATHGVALTATIYEYRVKWLMG